MEFRSQEIEIPFTSELDQEIEDLISEGIVQKISRSHDDERQRIIGIFRCDLEPEQSRYVLNIPIHPPMPSVPNVQAEVMLGSARARITDCEKFGVRIEVVASEAPNPSSPLFLEVIITSNQQ